MECFLPWGPAPCHMAAFWARLAPPKAKRAGRALAAPWPHALVWMGLGSNFKRPRPRAAEGMAPCTAPRVRRPCTYSGRCATDNAIRRPPRREAHAPCTAKALARVLRAFFKDCAGSRPCTFCDQRRFFQASQSLFPLRCARPFRSSFHTMLFDFDRGRLQAVAGEGRRARLRASAWGLGRPVAGYLRHGCAVHWMIKMGRGSRLKPQVLMQIL
ncbi:MAG: hypothetical protein J3K34DRAFT_410067 [Monoraphidium minutum]|nr:MAG: hypothetical protein J3K34DRAFT_410067 [Monoraphidium minutum]